MNRWKCLHGVSGAVIDTMVWIYLFENHRKYGAVCEELIHLAGRGYFNGTVTAVTLSEVLVKPYQMGNVDIADRYRSALTSTPGIVYEAVDPRTAAIAAALRARYRLPLPDMLQCAAALKHEKPVLVTNDRDLLVVDELRVVLLDDVL